MRARILGIIALGFSGAARAESPRAALEQLQPPQRLRLEWHGSERCRPTTEVFDGLRRLLGADPNVALSQEFAVDATIARIQEGWSLVLSTRGPDGSPIVRELEAPSCAEVAQAAALVLSVWMQRSPRELSNLGEEDEALLNQQASPLAVVPRGPSAGGPSPIVPASYPRLLLRRGTVLHGRSRRWRGELALGMTAMAGALPYSSWGLMGRLGVVVDAWHVAAFLLWLDNSQTWAAAPGLVGGNFGLLASGIRAGWALPIAQFLNVQPGGWVMIGRLHGEGLGSLARSTPSNDGWGAAGLGMEAELKLGRCFLTMGGGNGLPFGRPRFLVGDSLLYRVPPVTWFGHLLVTATIP